MRIAIIGQKGIPATFGGVEKHVEALAIRLGKAGHEVIVYTRAWYAAPQKHFSKGVRTVVTPTVKSKHLDAIVHTLTSTLHAIFLGVDIIHYHGVGPALLSWIPRLLSPSTKVVATFHSIDRKHQKWGLIARVMLRLGEKAACTFPHETIVVSRGLQEYCRKHYGRDTHFLPNGVQAASKKSGTDAIRQFGLKKDGYIAMVSRLIPLKGAHYLIAAYKLLKRRGLTAGKNLVIIGDSAFSDAYVAKLRDLAKDDQDIVFTGYLSGKPLHQAFSNAYAVVHPSEFEGMPIAILEAMSYGKTVVSSDIPGNLEVTRVHGVNFKSKDVNDMADKLAYVIANPKFAKAKGAAARDFVMANYQWDDIARQTAAIYELLLAGNACRHLSLRTHP